MGWKSWENCMHNENLNFRGKHQCSTSFDTGVTTFKLKCLLYSSDRNHKGTMEQCLNLAFYKKKLNIYLKNLETNLLIHFHND